MVRGWASHWHGKEIIGAFPISGMSSMLLLEGVSRLKVALASSLSRVLVMWINTIILEPLSALPAPPLLHNVSNLSLEPLRPLLRTPTPHGHTVPRPFFHPAFMTPLDTLGGGLIFLLI